MKMAPCQNARFRRQNETSVTDPRVLRDSFVINPLPFRRLPLLVLLALIAALLGLSSANPIQAQTPAEQTFVELPALCPRLAFSHATRRAP